MIVFVDTSAFIAVLVTGDEHHAAARATWRDLVQQDHGLVTTNYVVVETCAILHRRFGLASVRSFLQDLIPVVRLEWIQPQLHETGVERFLGSGRNGPSLVDCVSFSTMRKLNLRRCFAFDPHFEDQGFDLVSAK